MSQLLKETVLEALRAVIDRESGLDVVAAGLISGVVLRGDSIGFLITIAPEDKERKAWLREACEAAVARLPGVKSVTAVLTAQTGAVPEQPQAKKSAQWNLTPVEGVKRLIAVASGKGGVGKSTTSVNLALALKQSGQRVGLLDADIYGPSIPRMLGLSGQPEIAGNKMLPLMGHGIACMSMGLITGDEAAILRGPMISKSLQQLLRATRWGSAQEPLDILLIDMPPGTGDIHLSLAQQAPLTGALIVTTPQEVAVMDARKCLLMFEKLGVPVLGVIENMSYLPDPATAKRIPLFGEGGGKRLADAAQVPFLGEIPIDIAICEAADRGVPYLSDSGHEAAHAYARIARLLIV